MNKLFNIKRENNTIEAFENFLNPDFVYIPVATGYTFQKSSGDYVFKEDVILKKGSDCIFSPISGTIVGKTNSMKYENEEIECLVIENDFKEKIKKRKGCEKYINGFTANEVLDLIKKYNACDSDIDITKKILVINGIDIDPYEKTTSFLINSYSSKILEAIDALSTIFEIKTTIFAIDNNDNSSVINLTNNIGTYPNINLKLLPDIYPIGFKEVLINKLLSKKQREEGYIYLTVEDVYNIYNVLKRKKPITEKFVTIAGNSIEKPIVVNVKIGVSMSDIIKNSCKVLNNKYYVVTNGLISGKTLTTLNNIITLKTRSIFLNTKNTEIEKKCINCGLCMRKCPVGLNPKYLKEHKKADRSKCINCGLCTYICPSKISFKDILGGKKNE